MTLTDTPWEPLSEWLQLDQSDSLTLRKEVLYADKFAKHGQDGVLEYAFEITPTMLDHLELSVKELISNGVAIPYASKHVGWQLAENRWGDVKAPYRGLNDKGKEALFLDVKFKDEATKQQGLAADVSVGVPPVFVDGLGRKYTNPLRHLAATSAPVIPGLNDWQAIAASFTAETFTPLIGDLAMPFLPAEKDDEEVVDEEATGAGGEEPKPGGPKVDPATGLPEQSIFDQILQVLELQIPPSADDTAKGVAILTALQMLKGRKQMAAPQTPGTPAPKVAPQAPGAGGGIQLSHENSPIVIDMVRQNRGLQLSHLVNTGCIDSNAAKELAGLFGTPEAIGLELSEGGDGSQFNKLVGILAANKPVAKAGRSGEFDSEQEYVLGHDESGGLVAMAEKRAAEAQENGIR